MARVAIKELFRLVHAQNDEIAILKQEIRLLRKTRLDLDLLLPCSGEEKQMTMERLYSALQSIANNPIMFPTLRKLVQIAMTIPVTSCCKGHGPMVCQRKAASCQAAASVRATAMPVGGPTRERGKGRGGMMR